jgi:XisH protein
LASSIGMGLGYSYAMPARDLLHGVVKRALQKDGWTITADPFYLAWSGNKLYIDLAAELIIADKPDQHIAVEVKSFLGRSAIHDLEQALGQFLLYEMILRQKEPDRTLYLAVTSTILTSLFERDFKELLIDSGAVRIFGVDTVTEEVKKWIPQRP